MANPICIYGNSILREKAMPIFSVSDEITALADRMLKIMYDGEGVGLAAEQIGRTEAIFVVDIPGNADLDEQGMPNNPFVTMPEVFINPEIIGTSDEMITADEGCMSFPGMYVPVARHAEVVVRYLNRAGEEKLLNAKGFLARAIQHEFDHLNGVLIVDRTSKAAKLKNAMVLRRFKKENEN